MLLYASGIIFFTFFYTSITFQSNRNCWQLKKIWRFCSRNKTRWEYCIIYSKHIN
jgi:hypothetical protein